MDIQPPESFHSSLLMYLIQAGISNSNSEQMMMEEEKHNGSYNSMICWLYNLKLNIPDEHFKSGIFSMVSE